MPTAKQIIEYILEDEDMDHIFGQKYTKRDFEDYERYKKERFAIAVATGATIGGGALHLGAHAINKRAFKALPVIGRVLKHGRINLIKPGMKSTIAASALAALPAIVINRITRKDRYQRKYAETERRKRLLDKIKNELKTRKEI